MMESPNLDALGMAFPGFAFNKQNSYSGGFLFNKQNSFPGLPFSRQNSYQRLDSFGRILEESIIGNPDILFTAPSAEAVSIKKEIGAGDSKEHSMITLADDLPPSSPYRQDSEVPGGEANQFESSTPMLVPAHHIKEEGFDDDEGDSTETMTLDAARQLSNLSTQVDPNPAPAPAPSMSFSTGGNVAEMKRTPKAYGKVIVPKHLKRPEYKYPAYNQKKQPVRSMKMFKNDDHFKEAVAEWKRKRALNNRSVRLCRERKQRELKGLEKRCAELEVANKSLQKNLTEACGENDLLLAAVMNRKQLSPSEEQSVRRLIGSFKKNSGGR